jgi:hypothetical protein
MVHALTEVMYADKQSAEVSGIARVRELSPGYLFVDEPDLIVQTATGGGVTQHAKALHDWFDKQGWCDEAIPYNDWCHWHSHPRMAVSPSPTDEQGISDFVTRGRLVSLIVNEKAEVSCQVNTLAGGTTLGNSVQVTLPSTFAIGLPAVDEKWWAKRIKECVTIVPWVSKVSKTSDLPALRGYSTGAAADAVPFVTSERKALSKKERKIMGQLVNGLVLTSANEDIQARYSGNLSDRDGKKLMSVMVRSEKGELESRFVHPTQAAFKWVASLMECNGGVGEARKWPTAAC